MLKAIMWTAIVIAVGIGALVAYASTLSDEFRISRTTHVSASPERIFPLIDDLKLFNIWNPFLKMDPDSKLDYAAITVGPGSSYTFAGGKAGAGRIEVTDSAKPSRVDMMLHMQKPMEAHNHLVFALEPRDGGTDVSWSMSGKRPLLGKILDVVFGMEKMVGKPFEQGLADLKTLAEK